MNIPDAAKKLRVSERVVYNMCRAGAIEAHKERGAWVLATVEAFLTVDFVAEGVDRSPQFINRLCRQERIKSRKVGHQRRIDFVDGMKFIIARQGGYQG